MCWDTFLSRFGYPWYHCCSLTRCITWSLVTVTSWHHWPDQVLTQLQLQSLVSIPPHYWSWSHSCVPTFPHHSSILHPTLSLELSLEVTNRVCLMMCLALELGTGGGLSWRATPCNSGHILRKKRQKVQGELDFVTFWSNNSHFSDIYVDPIGSIWKLFDTRGCYCSKLGLIPMILFVEGSLRGQPRFTMEPTDVEFHSCVISWDPSDATCSDNTILSQ